MLLLDQRVPVPEHNVLIQKRGKDLYVLQLMDSYKDEFGKRRSSRKRKMVGKIVEGSDGALMFPNEFYYEFTGQPKPEINHARTAHPGRKSNFSYTPGTVTHPCFALACRSVFITTSIQTMLEQSFGPKLADQIAFLASHYAAGNESCENIDVDSITHNVWDEAEGLTSQAVSRLMENIEETKMRDFFKRWIPVAAGNDAIAYDVTALTTLAKAIIEAELGYTHGTVEHKPQINFALFCNQKTGIPIFFVHYMGSLNDKSNLIHVIDTALDRGLPNNIHLVMDRGMTTLENIKQLNQRSVKYISGVPLTIKGVKDRLREFLGLNLKLSESGFALRCKKGDAKELFRAATYEYDWHGTRINLHVYHSENRALSDRLALMDGVQKCQEYIELHGEPPKDNYHAEAASCFERAGRGRNAHWELNHDKMNELEELAGCFALFSSPELGLDAKTALEQYRQREIDEACFDCLKNDLNGLPLNIHDERRLNGKFFILFLALILKKKLMELAGPLLNELNRSYSYLVKILENQRCEYRSTEGVVVVKGEMVYSPLDYVARVDALTKNAQALMSRILGPEVAKAMKLKDAYAPKKSKRTSKAKR